MPGPLAATIRAKYPGAYDDLDDATLERQVLAKYPQYADLAEPEPAAAKPERSMSDRVADALPTVGGAIGGFVGKVPGLRTLSAGIGGAAGQGYGSLVKHAGEIPGAVADVARNLVAEPRATLAGFGQGAREGANKAAGAGATQAAAQGLGEGVAGGLKLAGRGMYRAGALPLVQMFGKYGDLVKKGVEAGVPVTKKGLEKAGRLKTGAQATKAAAVSAADQRASVLTKGVTNDALTRVAGSADDLRRAGLGDPTKAHLARAGRIEAENPPGLTPSALDRIKGTIDDTLGPAYKKLRGKEALNPTESMNMALSHSAGDTLSTVVPNYKGLNRDVMDAVGLQKMISRRLQGNQGLENALTMLNPAMLPARIAMLPGVATTAGVKTYQAGKHAAQPVANSVRAALLALLGGEDE
jgi:hypothetical protein